jgi:hypothetical protein
LVAASDLVGVNHLRSIGFGVPECLFGESMFIVVVERTTPQMQGIQVGPGTSQFPPTLGNEHRKDDEHEYDKA